MHPPRIWLAWRVKLQDQLGVLEIGFNPACQLRIWYAINLKIAGLATAMV